jgi:CubicO group peptidase (beta-lactamase class C family)
MCRRILVLSFILAALAAASGGCVASPARVTSPDYWPTQEWRTSTPEEQGLDSSSILAMLDQIQSENLRIHSILIVLHGYLVTEVYFPPYRQETKHPVFSITKSVTSAMVGKAIQEGYVKNVQQKVLEFFPLIAQEAKDPKLKDITLEHLLTMSAGYNTTTMPNLTDKDAGFDTVQHILTYNSVLVPPGASFHYDSGLPHLLSAIIQKGAGRSLQAYTVDNLMQPLGITDFSWSSDPGGITTGATGLMLLPRDMAKIGFLYLHNGEWNGEQLLPARWVKTSTTKHIETKGQMNPAEDHGYGYLWWIDPFGGYSAHGFGGQFIFVIPSLDMVIVFTGGLPDSLFQLPGQLVESYLIPSAAGAKPLAADAQAVRELSRRIQAIQQGQRITAPLPEMAQKISGRTYQLTLGVKPGMYDAFTLTFSGGDTYQNEPCWPGGGSFKVTGSLGGSFHDNKVTFSGPPVQELFLPVRGYWQDEETFVEEYIQNLNTEIDLVTQKYTFTGDRVTIVVNSSMGLFSYQVSGEAIK